MEQPSFSIMFVVDFLFFSFPSLQLTTFRISRDVSCILRVSLCQSLSVKSLPAHELNVTMWRTLCPLSLALFLCNISSSRHSITNITVDVSFQYPEILIKIMSVVSLFFCELSTYSSSSQSLS